MTADPAARADPDPGPPAPDLPVADPTGPSTGRRAWRWAGRVIALIALAITIMMVALAIGMRLNDRAIEEHLGTATAAVLSVSPLRTGIEFVDGSGSTVRPEGGVLYPGLLALGQQFVVEYSTVDPQIARVAGRTATVGNIMIIVTLAVTYLVALPALWWCRRRARLPLWRMAADGRRGPDRGTAVGSSG